MTPDRVAIVYGSVAGIGGLGQSVSAAITAVADGSRTAYAFGPGHSPTWSLPGGIPPAVWEHASPGIWPWMGRYSWLRWRSGDLAFLRDRRLGRWAARQVQRIRPQYCYLFTQVAHETLRWARAEGVPLVPFGAGSGVCAGIQPHDGAVVVDPILIQQLVAARRAEDPLEDLSAREREVLGLMAEGRSNAGIARQLWVTDSTVEKHVHSIFMKLRIPETGDDHRRVLAVIGFLQTR